MHVAVTRPKQTDTEGLKLPVVYESSPYYAGTAGFGEGTFWDVKHELGETPKPRVNPEVTRTGKRPIISNLKAFGNTFNNGKIVSFVIYFPDKAFALFWS